MKLGITTNKLGEEHGIQTWRYKLECPDSEEDNSNAFCGTFYVETRVVDGDVYFNWIDIDYGKKCHNLEAMGLWVVSHHEELESAINRGYIEIETE